VAEPTPDLQEWAEWHVPVQPADVDRIGLMTAVLESQIRQRPDCSAEELAECIATAGRVATSASFLAGAVQQGFVQGIDAYVRGAPEYGIRVVL